MMVTCPKMEGVDVVAGLELSVRCNQQDLMMDWTSGEVSRVTPRFSAGAIQGLEVSFIKMGKNGGGAAFGWELQQRSRVQVWIH